MQVALADFFAFLRRGLPCPDFKLTTMNLRRLTALPVFALALSATGGAATVEENVWPLWVRHVRAEPGATVVESASGLGPLWFYQRGGPDRPEARGLRPFYLAKRPAGGGPAAEAHFLYPVLTYRAGPDERRWSLLNLVNRSVARDGTRTAFDLWPVYFSRQTGDPATSYRAVFPLGGTVTRRFGHDRVAWFLFPLYGRFEQGGATTTTVPWPFVKVLRGDGHAGFELWPLFGRREKPGLYREQFYLWPLIYRNERVDEAGRTAEELGVLPFYARDRSEGYRSETYLWPFFGYVDRTAPYRYHATHYFWPLFVQGRGDDRLVNRWAPFYTHSRIKGTDKTWVLWPLWRSQSWTEAGLRHERTQVLYFLYHANVQRSAARPDAAPAAKVHLWPLVSAWDNGAGHRQWQVPSPLEVFFPHNDNVRLAWSPLFALYRYDERAPGDFRHSLLWDAITYERRRSAGTRSFHLGPLFSVESGPGTRRIALGAGLIGLRRPAGASWRLFVGEFSRRSRDLQEPTLP